MGQAKGCEWSCLRVLSGPDAPKSLDDTMTAVGLRALEADDWIPLGTGSAQVFLTALLHKTLAYNAERMPLEDAEGLAHAFLSGVRVEEAEVFTNTDGIPGHYPGGVGPGYMPATDATFDSGLVVLGPDVTAIYWVADED